MFLLLFEKPLKNWSIVLNASKQVKRWMWIAWLNLATLSPKCLLSNQKTTKILLTLTKYWPKLPRFPNLSLKRFKKSQILLNIIWYSYHGIEKIVKQPMEIKTGNSFIKSKKSINVLGALFDLTRTHIKMFAQSFKITICNSSY